MKRAILCCWLTSCICSTIHAATIYETTSPYHHIQVTDQAGMRTLSFDGSTETRISISNPLEGHFEYTGFFHMAWLWNTNMTNILMMGLGGGSTQRMFQNCYPDLTIETVELDPTVVEVAKKYFGFAESTNMTVHVEDGRVYLKRMEKTYGAIIMDAYTGNRYGSYIPYHLATKEFFEIVDQHLATNGVVAYNVIGSLQGWRADIVGSLYKTMKAVFPRVYLFPARESMNIVMIGTKSSTAVSNTSLQERTKELSSLRRLKYPGFGTRIQSIRDAAPPSATSSPILTDDFAPIDGLLKATSKR